MRKTILIFIAVFAILLNAEQTEKDNLAVLDLKVAGVADHFSTILSDKMRSELAKTGFYNVINRENMAEIMGEQAFQNSGNCTSDKCVVEIGKVLGVAKIITGSVGKLGNTFVLTIKIIDIESGQNENVVTKTVKYSEEQLIEAVETALIELKGIPKDKQLLIYKKDLKLSQNSIDSAVFILKQRENELTGLQLKKSELQQQQNGVTTELELYRSIYSKNEIVLQSAIFPGLGQYKSNRKLQGITYSVLFVAGIGWYISSATTYNSKVDDYHKAISDFDTNPTAGNLSKTRTLKSDFDDARTASFTAIGIIAGVYLWNIADAFWFTEEDPRIQQLKVKPELGININGKVKAGLSFNF